MFTDNAELHPKTLLNGNLMDVFEQKEQVSSLQSSEEELRGTAEAHHHSLAESHHEALSSTSPCGHEASPMTGASCLLSWCCITLVILAAEFPAVQEHKVTHFFSTPADEKVFRVSPGTRW